MIREMFTMTVNNLPVGYYVEFDKTRTRFQFQPGFIDKSAPSFTILLIDGNLSFDKQPEEDLASQAIAKVRELLNTDLFDQI